MKHVRCITIASVAKYSKHLPHSQRVDWKPSSWDKSLITGQATDTITNFRKPVQKNVDQNITLIGLVVK